MKLIIALIQPHRLEAVRQELIEADIHRLTVFDASGYGRQAGNVQYFRGRELETTLIEIQIALNDKFVRPAIEAIKKGAKGEDGGQVGDGKIFVVPLDNVIRISDNTEGKEAI